MDAVNSLDNDKAPFTVFERDLLHAPACAALPHTAFRVLVYVVEAYKRQNRMGLCDANADATPTPVELHVGHVPGVNRKPTFYDALRTLERHGFIRIQRPETQGQHNRIYLSTKWREGAAADVQAVADAPSHTDPERQQAGIGSDPPSEPKWDRKRSSARVGVGSEAIPGPGQSGIGSDPRSSPKWDRKRSPLQYGKHNTNNPNTAGACDRESGIDEANQFDDFWRNYPRKTGRGAAEIAWDKACTRCPPSEILAALARQKSSPAWTRDGGRYIPNPARWLNEERWSDVPDLEHARSPGGCQPARDIVAAVHDYLRGMPHFTVSGALEALSATPEERATYSAWARRKRDKFKPCL